MNKASKLAGFFKIFSSPELIEGVEKEINKTRAMMTEGYIRFFFLTLNTSLMNR